jgi:enoyl-CoA hydratase
MSLEATPDPALVRVDSPLAGCAVLTLNRPEAMNALSLAMREQLAATIKSLATDPAVHVLIVTGAGKAFCAGLDLKELRDARDVAAILASSRDTDPIAALSAFRGPVIGAINGPAITGGFEIALACDLLVASENASFADTHARVGVLPGWGLSQRLSRRIGVARAKEMSLTGLTLSARQAEDWGLVNRVVAPADLLTVAVALATEMLRASPAMLTAMKRLIDDGAATTLERGLEIERERSTAWNTRLDAATIETRKASGASSGRAPA